MRAISEHLREASCGDAVQIDYLYVLPLQGSTISSRSVDLLSAARVRRCAGGSVRSS